MQVMSSARARRRAALWFLSIVGIAVAVVSATAQQPLVGGPNVNIIGGPAKFDIVKGPDGRFLYRLLEGDPGQRQNEVSCQVDSRNQLVIGCAFNDYTPVEIAGRNGDGETGDSWIGLAVSTDGGFSWRKLMMGAFPQDLSLEGQASPLFGLDAAADPTWVAGPGGVSFLSGIAFNRDILEQPSTTTSAEQSGPHRESVVFVQKYRNHNNVENDPNPFKADGPPVLFPLTGSGPNEFHDKSWGGVAPNGDFHLVWATFPLPSRNKSVIWRAVCREGDLSRCSTAKVSEGDFIFNGAAMTFHALRGWTDITYRRRKSATAGDALMFVRCYPGSGTPGVDGYDTGCTRPVVMHEPPEIVRSDGSKLGAMFDQGSGVGLFRNISNPTLAADLLGRVYIAWAERAASGGPAPVDRDSRIMLSIGHTDWRGRLTFSRPVELDSLTTNPPPGRGHQIRPQMWFGAGKLHISAATLHKDQSIGVFTLQKAPDPGRPGGEILKYVESRVLTGELELPPAANQPTPNQIGRTFTELVWDIAPANPTVDAAPNFSSQLLRRHTERIGLWTGTPAILPSGMPSFTFNDVWRSRIRFNKVLNRYEESEFNPWGLEMFNKGTIAFAGDYDSVVTRAFVPNVLGTGYLPNATRLEPTPVYVGWTDNRNVRKLVELNKYLMAGTELCDGSEPAAALTRNQDIYIARAGQGLYVYTVGNQKPLGDATLPGFGTFRIKRAFVLQFQNAVNATKHYRAVIAPSLSGVASWKQFETVRQIDLSIPPFSIASRQVFAQSSDPRDSFLVSVFEINRPGGSILPGGLRDFAMLNPDRSAPSLQPPILDGNNIDPTDPRSAEIFTPDPLSPDPLSSNITPDPLSPDPLSPDPLSPDPLSPDPLSPDPLSPDPLSPDPLSPDPLSPDPLSPDPLSPDPLSPDPLSPDPLSVPAGGVRTDTVVGVTNASNTSAGMAVKIFATKPLPPNSRLQVSIIQPYFTTTQRNCKLLPQNSSTVLATVTDPELVRNVADLTFDPLDASPKNLTVGVRPGATFYVQYRWIDPDASDNVVFQDENGRWHSVDPNFNPATDLITVPIPMAISTPDALRLEGTCGGPSQPACPTSDDPEILITATTLRDFAVGDEGRTQQLTAVGGVPFSEGSPYVWSDNFSLPEGLSLSPSGLLSGTPGEVGVFPVVITATDSQGTQARRSYKLRVLPRAIAQSLTTPEDTSIGITLTGDSGDAPASFAISRQPTNGTVADNDGTRYTPAGNFNGADNFAFTLTANGLRSEPATVSITVTPVNDAPVAVDDTASTTAGIPVSVNVLANDTDVENDSLTPTAVSAPVNGGFATIGDDKKIVYTPGRIFAATDSFTYTISDGNGGTDTATVVVSISLADPPPTAEALIDCSVANPSGGDFIDRGFYVPSYPGLNLRAVDLWFSTTTAGTYQLSLTARANSYDGPLIGTASVSVALESNGLQGTLATFQFDTPTVQPGSLVTFAIAKISGPAALPFYSVASPAGCPIQQTNTTAPPLSTPRRDGVTTRIYGDRAPFSFKATGDFGVGSDPEGIATGDLNGDGHADVVTANFGSNNISVLLGTGTASFGDATNYATGGGPRDVALGDLDQDDDLDIVIAQLGGGVSIAWNNGDGTFSTPLTTLTAPGANNRVVVEHVDNDGWLDIVVAKNGATSTNNVGVILSLSGDGFAAERLFSAGTFAWGVAVEDVNGDSTRDLIVSNRDSGDVSVLLGTGSPTTLFGAATSFRARPESSEASIHDLTIGDLNGDDISDVVVGSNSSFIALLMGNGDGTLSAPTFITHASFARPVKVLRMDVDRDGPNDLAVMNFDGGMTFFRSHGNGTFTHALTLSTGSSSPSAVADGLFDGDDWPDIVFARKLGAAISLLRNTSF